MSRRSTESIGRDILQHLTDDLNSKSSQALFDLWNTDIRDPKTKEIIQPKRIHCKTCKSWDDIKAVVTKMQKDGKSLGEIRKATISHKNVLGEFIIDRKGFNPRNVRDDLHITTERIIREWGNKRRPGYGDLAVKSWKTKIKQNWDKLAPNDKKKFIKLFGVKGDLREIHKGHGFASMIGGLADPSNIAPQLGALNTALKENPRFAKDLMEQWGMGGDGTKAFFNSRLAKIDPTNIPDAVWLHLGETGVVDPEQLEILTAKLGELKQQGVNIEEAAQRIWETGEEVTLDKINKHLPTPDPTSIPTPETPTATKRLPEVVSYEDQFVKQAYSEKDANMLREWLSDLKLDGWGDGLSKLPKPPKIPAWAKVGTAATLYGLYGDVTQAAETSQEVQEEGWGPRQVMEATSAATGLASLIPPLAPVTAPISLVTGVTGAAMGRIEDKQALLQDQLENPDDYMWNKDNTQFIKKPRAPVPTGPVEIKGPSPTATQVINQQRLDLIESGKLKAEGDDPISRTVSGAVDWLTNWYKKEEN